MRAQGDEPPRHPARNRGTHAAPPTPLRSLVKSFLVVALVAAAVAVLIHFRGASTGDDEAQGPVVAAPTLTPTATPTASPSPRPTRIKPTPTARPTRTHPAPPPTHTPDTVVAVAPLTVLNNSTISGLASQSAEEFHARGWPIASVGNFTGRVAETTAYYTPGVEKERLAAKKLAGQFPGITRISERFDGLPGSGLTVVLTRYYAD
jgi:hypothetical protein